MPIIWVVEQTKQPFSVGQYLMGDFPTRVFRSFDSFRKLSRLKTAELPSVIVLDVEQENLSADMERFFATHFSRVAMLALTSGKFKSSLEFSCLDKPIDAISLTRAIRALLLDVESTRDIIQFQDVKLQVRRNVVRVGGESSELTHRETRILEFMLKHVGRCVTREELVEEVWSGVHVSPRTVDSHISRLRKVIEQSETLRLIGVYGKGYSLNIEE